ncbi:MAG: murein biosynthesis integral membrane protein MurJ [Candidatus Auribacterota bacterium]
MNNAKPISKHEVTRKAGTFGAVTMLSRVLGLVRDMLSASVFGTSSAWDAFVIAFTIPNMFRMMLGEGALAGAFVPLFSEYLHKDGEEKAWDFTNRVITLQSLVLIILVILACFALGGVLLFDISPRLREVLILSMLLSPYLFFICNVGLFMGILNAFYHFFLPAFAPVILNIVLIIVMISVVRVTSISVETKVSFVVVGVLIGGMIQLMSHFRLAVKHGLRFRVIFDLKDEGVQKIWRLMLPAVLGLSITQINLMIDRFLAYIIGEGAASSLYYANRIIQLPVGVFGVALATTSFPLLAQYAAQENKTDYRQTLIHVIKMMIFIAAPATSGLLVLSYPIIKMIFQYNEFDSSSTLTTAQVLFCYSIGLIAYCVSKTVIRAFYSLQDTRTPVKIGLITLVLNVVLNLILMIPLKQAGLALSTSITSFIGLFLLFHQMGKRVGSLMTADLVSNISKAAFCSGVMMLVSYILYKVLDRIIVAPLFNKIMTGIVPVAVGVLVYLAVAHFMNMPQTRELLKLVGIKIPPRTNRAS